MEKLCTLQWKFSPLRECSPEFLRNHPNPKIKVYMDLAKSPNAFIDPQIPTGGEFANDIAVAFDKIVSGKASAKDALTTAQERQQPLSDKQLARWQRIAPKLTEEWSKE